MASLLKMDLKDLFSKKKNNPGEGGNKGKSSSSLDSAVIKRIVIGLVLILVVVGTYFFLLKPNLNQQENQIAQVKTWEQQISSCKAEIENLQGQLGVDVIDMMRTKEAEFKEQNLKGADNESLLNAMVNTPKLIERPIVTDGQQAIIGRPPENVLNLI